MKSAYQIIRRPVITEKGLGVKETEATLVFEVALKASKTEIKQAVQSIFKVKVDRCVPPPSPARSGAGASSPAIVPTGKRRMCG
jgi:ribosomal protein L23